MGEYQVVPQTTQGELAAYMMAVALQRECLLSGCGSDTCAKTEKKVVATYTKPDLAKKEKNIKISTKCIQKKKNAPKPQLATTAAELRERTLRKSAILRTLQEMQNSYM